VPFAATKNGRLVWMVAEVRIRNLGTLHGSEIPNLENKGQFMIVYHSFSMFIQFPS